MIPPAWKKYLHRRHVWILSCHVHLELSKLGIREQSSRWTTMIMMDHAGLWWIFRMLLLWQPKGDRPPTLQPQKNPTRTVGHLCWVNSASSALRLRAESIAAAAPPLPASSEFPQLWGTLKLTVRPWKWMLGRLVRFLLGRLGLFSGAFAVSFRECFWWCKISLLSDRLKKGVEPWV